ncbi:MAG: hypothetical protein ACO3P1_03395, partial [Pseudomonadales bacterium]
MTEQRNRHQVTKRYPDLLGRLVTISSSRTNTVLLFVARTAAAMGYRALLKQYIRHLLKVAGDHHIHTAEASEIL